MTLDLVCEWCGGTFPRLHAKGPTPKFCTESHRQQAYLDRRFRRLSDRVAELERRLDEMWEYVAHAPRCALMLDCGPCDCGHDDYVFTMLEAEAQGLD